MATLKKGDKKLLKAWAFYDWANSVYTLTIASSIFPIFYSALFVSEIKVVHAFGYDFKSTALITFLTAFTFMVVAITSPVLSGIADYLGNKKAFMKFFCYMGGIGCIGLYFFSLEHIYLSLLCYFMGLLGYWGSLVFYNSYLPDIAHEDQQDRISAVGFAYGYIGSVILLIINLVMVMTQEDGEGKMTMMRYSFVTVGLWWMLFSQYSFKILPKGVAVGKKLTKQIIFNGLRELKGVWNQLKDNIHLRRYLRGFFVFSMGVQTIMLVAVYFGEEEIAWEDADHKTIGLIGSILVIQLIAIVGAMLTARASKKYGNIPTLIGVNVIWMLLCVYAFFMVSPMQFYIAAAIVGFVMGGVQSLGRSTYSKYIPPTEDTTSYFSFYDVAEKIGIVIGMAIFGFIDQYTNSMRNAILFLLAFFLIGILLLLRVPYKKAAQF